MSSMESFRVPNPAEGPENLEQKMQRIYLTPMNTELNKVRDLLPDLDPASRVADLLEDAFYELNTLPEENMDEEELNANLENFKQIVADMQAAADPEEAYAVALKGLEG